MSIIENALKKAGSQGLVVENGGQESVTINKPNRSGVESNFESSGVKEGSNVFPSEQQVVVDWSSLAENGFIDNNNAKSQLAEEFRVIKRPLVNNIQGAENNGINRSNLILICSSLPGEGKTFVSINLALSIANERDKKVLLIDADVEKPSISKQLGINSPRGLIEYLEDDKVTFSDILLKTDLPNFSLITAGKRHKYSTELLSSQRMYLFAEEVSRRYKDRIVIFDSPPLLVATQAQILAELVGQVVLVIAAEATPQSVVNESVAKLSNCDVVMTLLNKTRKEIDIYGHNYSYGKYGHL
ncbi:MULTISPECIES: XrtA-associated tyrosine autokinase [Methylomonas]|uniref:non-specific protein-tyrosine kinase n=2 Tax=Methylomonas TaxID=416 RepID=A0A126T1D4_9GAMM|nr:MULTISPECIES: XrtA-associated tyrosine autokinase [Methylomonas]AMK75887.1 protein tyrosine kinase [Methylomonas denitrificans]OAI01349.1 protein tyrosine kinase [Methylomonas methanica]TCV79237.1 exopolysaccharide/PEP-CTERM locus tyrosine autokinase [Methylomonas methanica]